MRKYDLLAVSLLLFAGVFTVWLGLWGPIDLEKLKTRQPLMAALIALGAGGLAYRGAMAKVGFDRQVHEEQNHRQRQNLHTKLLFAALIFAIEMQKTTDKFKYGGFRKEVTAKDFMTPWPSEFDEAWQNIALLEEESATLLANLKYNYSLLEKAVKNLNQDTTWEINWATPNEIAPTVKLLKEMDSYASDFSQNLQKLKIA